MESFIQFRYFPYVFRRLFKELLGLKWKAVFGKVSETRFCKSSWLPLLLVFGEDTFHCASDFFPLAGCHPPLLTDSSLRFKLLFPGLFCLPFCDSVLFLCVSSVLYLLCTVIEDSSRYTANLNWKQNLLKIRWGWVSLLDCLEKSECNNLLWCAKGSLWWSFVPVLQLRQDFFFFCFSSSGIGLGNFLRYCCQRNDGDWI